MGVFRTILGNSKILAFSLLLTVVTTSFARSYLRIETTLIGYELGSLKDKESLLLEKRGRLQMELAKISDKDHLQMLAGTNQRDPGLGAFLAAKDSL
ncbi:MAG: hypothetical protein AB7T49_02510 [Oligoflexales bacterium]